MSMTRWDPFREVLSLREAMQQLMEESFVRPGAATRGGGAQQLALDAHEEDDAYVVRASLPGVKPEDIQVSVLGDTLTIRAETGGQSEQSRGNYLVRERHTGTFHRSLTLPAQIDSNAVDAQYEHGVLTLRLPKSPAAQPRRIQVRAGSGAGTIGTGRGQPAGGASGPQQAGMQGQAHGGAGQAGGMTGQAAQSDAVTGAAQGQRGQEAGRLPSLEEQTPGMDADVERRTAAEARAFYSGESPQNQTDPQAQPS